ncbi:uncharacterized protein TNCV_3226891 [Trichonephila clavipes]|nr:uncharacterized protein TNCV_3226891 [Trichonephila clavipes]
MPLGLDSNLGEDMDVCKCIVPSRDGGTLNSSRAASPLLRLVAGDEKLEAPAPPPECSTSNLEWNRAKNRNVTCMVLKTTANDRRRCSPLP